MARKRVKLEEGVLKEQDRIAAGLRERFERSGVFVINLIGSPGSGKTSLLEVSVPQLAKDFAVAVIEGDVQTDNDTRRLRKAGIQAHQIQTRGACHLTSWMIEKVLPELPVDDLDILFIENVGNLVCPTSFYLGEDARAAVISAPEGEDKPSKYPMAITTANVLVITKADLAEASDCNLEVMSRYATDLNGNLTVFTTSARNNTGLAPWVEWIGNAAREKNRESTG